MSTMLVFPPNPKVIATIDSVVTGAFNGVVTGAFSGILFNFIDTITLVVNI